MKFRAGFVIAGWMVFLSGCSAEEPSTAELVPSATLEALHDPNTCRSCHASIVEQWEGSMHAYASHDPVFIAMNARGSAKPKEISEIFVFVAMRLLRWNWG